MAGIERIPPHSDDAEKSVLGSILLDQMVLSDILPILQPEDFYSKSHQEIYSAAIELSHKGEAVDTLTVSEELSKRKTLEMVGGRTYIGYLSSIVPSTANAEQYARIVEEKSLLRQLIHKASEISDQGYEGALEASEVLDFAERSIFEIAQSKQSRDYQELRTVLIDQLGVLDELSKHGSGLTGITTGFHSLDKKTSGLQKSDLIIVAARPGMGKTSLALNIAQNAAIKGGAHVLFFSLEMSKEQLAQRMLSMESNVDMQRIKTGNLQDQDWANITTAVESLSKANIFIDDTAGLSVMEMKSKCRRLKAEKKLDMIIVDYLQLMSFAGKSENRQQEITAISRFLKLIAREMDCPVIVLSQLSRSPEQRTDRRPILSDLRESGAIEQDADIVLLLYRDDYYHADTDTPNICEVIIAKHRSGPTGTEELVWLAQYTKFADKSNIDIDDYS